MVSDYDEPLARGDVYDGSLFHAPDYEYAVHAVPQVSAKQPPKPQEAKDAEKMVRAAFMANRLTEAFVAFGYSPEYTDVMVEAAMPAIVQAVLARLVHVRLGDLFDLNLFFEMLLTGYVRRQWSPDGHLAILNYTEKATYERVWNDVTKTCRGLIYDVETAEVRARPFRKFFNYGEPGAELGSLYEPASVTNKVDGSLGVLYEGVDGLAIATRGSFTSDQAVHATELLRERYGEWRPHLYNATYLFEIVYPENRIVVNYGDMDDLVLLGVVENSTGHSLPVEEVAYEWPGPVAETMPVDNLAQALELEPRPNAEGVVVHFLHSDTRVKIKQDDYVELHRAITGMNARVLWERLGRGDTIGQICELVPEEFWPWITQTGNELLRQEHEISVAARREYMNIVNRLPDGWTRKDFAEKAGKSPYRRYLFLILDERCISDLVWKAIRPSAERAMFARTEDAA